VEAPECCAGCCWYDPKHENTDDFNCYNPIIDSERCLDPHRSEVKGKHYFPLTQVAMEMTREDIEKRPEVDYTWWERDKDYYKTGLSVYLKGILKAPFPLFCNGFPVILLRSESWSKELDGKSQASTTQANST